MNIFRSSQSSWHKSLLLLSVLSLPLQTAYAIEKATKLEQTNSVTYRNIAKQYLPNFGSLETALMREQMGIAELDEYEKRQIVLEIFQRHAVTENRADNKILTRNAWEDLNLFKSASDDESINTISIINNTRTIMGEVKLSQMLTNPTTDISVLKNRQAMLKELIENETLADNLDVMLQDLKDVEEPVLSFWRLRDEKQFDLVFFKQEKFKKYNNSALANELSTRFQDFMKVGYFPAYFIWVFKQAGVTTAGIRRAADRFVEFMKSDAEQLDKFKAVGGIFAAFTVFMAFYGFMIYQEHKIVRLIQTVRKKMYKVSEFVFGLDDIAKECAGNKALSQGLIRLTHKGNMLEAVCEEQSTVADLVSNLESWSVRSTNYFTHFCTPVGKALASYKQMKQEGQQFAPMLELVGELDACLSMAKLYKKLSSDTGATVSFVEFLEQDTGELEIKGMWNPFIAQDSVIMNDVALGERFNSRNLIVTGPNAGGKSTVLKGIILNAIFAQTFGIAMATSMRITPYSKICTHLNIIDQSGIKSLFQAEVSRAQELIDTISGLKKGEFALTIMDEVFNGTNPVEGEAAAFSIGEYIADFPKSNCIIATHFPRLTLLPKFTDGAYTNYKVFVNKMKSGSFSYPYKFVEGTADQRIAIDILEAEGFNTRILKRARDIIEKPEDYTVE